MASTPTSTSTEPGAPRPLPPWVFAAAALAVFGRSLFSAYAYDGAMLMERWTVGGGIPLSSVVSLRQYSEATSVMSWRPLPVAFAIVLDIGLFGASPAFSHLVNILLHAASAWLLCRLMAPRAGEAPARIGAALFLLHPLVTEAVLCAGFRFDLAAMALALLALWAGLAGAHPAAVAALAAAGLLCKEIAVVAVAAIPAATLWLDGGRRRAALLAGWLAAAFLVYLYIWSLFKYEGYTNEFLGGGGRLLGMANFAVAWGEIYFRRLLLPWPLRVDYAFEPVASLLDPRVAAALLVALGAAGVAGPLAWRDPLARLGLLWIVASFAPVSQVVPVPDPVAERFCYFPLAGVAMLAAAAWRRLPPHRALLPAAGAVLAVLALLSHRRSWDWSDDVTLNIANWEQPRDTRPVARRALGALHTTRALERAATGDTAAADRSFAAARANLDALLATNPDDAEGHRLLGVWFLIRGQGGDARRHAQRALELAPDNPDAHRLATAAGLGDP